MVIRRQEAAGVGMAPFSTALGLYGGVLWWSGELQGFIAHETTWNMK
jgi:hypothetical protein